MKLTMELEFLENMRDSLSALCASQFVCHATIRASCTISREKETVLQSRDRVEIFGVWSGVHVYVRFQSPSGTPPRIFSRHKQTPLQSINL